MVFYSAKLAENLYWHNLQCIVLQNLWTTGKICPGKAPDRKLKLTDREIRSFRRYISKNRHSAVIDLIK